MSEWRLLQLDFYNILAPAMTKVPEKDPDAETRPRIEPDDDAFLDLKIRALMHGFDEEVDPNDVAHLLEEEPIPLRSMRIPIRRNVSAGWAPNGYGKTYIFDYLQKRSRGKVSLNLREESHLKYWERERDRLRMESPESNLVPFHGRGSIFEQVSTGKIVSILEFPQITQYTRGPENVSRKYFGMIREAKTSDHGEGADWAFSTSANWIEVANPDPIRHEDCPKTFYEDFYVTAELDGFLEKTDLFEDLKVEYFEVPALAEKKSFAEALVLPDGLSKNVFFSEQYRNTSQHRHSLLPTEQSDHIVESKGLLEALFELADEIQIICDPNLLGNDSVSSGVRQTQIERILQDIETSVDYWFSFGEAICDEDEIVWSREAFDILRVMNFITAIPDLEHYDLRLRTIDRLFGVFSDSMNRAHRLKIPGIEALNLLSVLIKYAIVERNQFNRGTDELTKFGFEHLDFLFEDMRLSPHPFVQLVAHYESVRRFNFFHTDQHKIKHPNPRKANKRHLDKHPLKSSHTAYKNAYNRARTSFPVVVAGQDCFERDVAIVERRITIGRIFGGDNVTLNVLNALGIYPFRMEMLPKPMILENELNGCLSPKNHKHNPWGVEASLSIDEIKQQEQSPVASINFHRAGTEKMNTLKPEYLSFGMRSETLLQLRLFRSLHEKWNGKGPDLLIIDEPEIGRSEYWTTMLIHRLRRFEQQFGSDGEQSVLIVSHRGDVLENCTQSGDYTIMHRTPQSEE
jgi:hypothetical protein